MLTRSNQNNLIILYEDNHLIIVNKRAGDIVQGDKTGDTPLSEIVKKYIKIKYDKPGEVYLGTAHRLDRPTSGIVIFSKTSKALSRLNSMLLERKIKKIYWAIVKNKPNKKNGSIISWLKKNSKNNKSYNYLKKISGSKEAILEYNLLKKLDNYYLLEINLKTGRHHQIRAQLSSINSIIKGDLKYGAKRSNKDGSICLHSRKVEFTHPVSKKNIRLIADTPNSPIWNSCH
ncbi:MAG: RNA pseudouridine synthase [Flavobacteriaceae bacterium]|nr:RNA pseudouridine synthase [Flavobacteriaceae bacterium]